jgi:hypothetical protein
MFDLNAIVNAALTAAVAEAIKPLIERITALENNPAIGVDTVLEQRVVALENITAEFSPTMRPAVHIDEAKMVEALNSQEWFWEKLRRTTDAQIEQAMDDHCSAYNHDDYDNVVSNWNDEDPADFLREGDLCDQIDDRVHETLRNATFSISI